MWRDTKELVLVRLVEGEGAVGIAVEADTNLPTVTLTTRFLREVGAGKAAVEVGSHLVRFFGEWQRRQEKEPK